MDSDDNDKLLAQLKNPIVLRTIRSTTAGSLDVPRRQGREGATSYVIQIESVDGKRFLVPFSRTSLEDFMRIVVALLHAADEEEDDAASPKKPN
jgi:hypothetical protein